MKWLPALCLLFLAAAAQAAEKPNIVLILADDFGYGSLGCYGADGKLIRTPHLDRLAREGRRFTDASTTSSVCSPTRYSLMTGRYCWRTSEKSGVLGTFSPLHIETDRLTLASLLKKHGYNTAAVGKWHLGYGKADESPVWKTDYSAELSPGPLDIGFDYHFGVPSNHGDLTGIYVENRFVYGLRRGRLPEGMKLSGPDADNADFKNSYTKDDTEAVRAQPMEIDAPRRVNERVMPVLTEKAADWIRKQSGETPFFLYYTPVAVHNPVTPDKDLVGSSAAGPYGDWIHQLDRSVGDIMAALESKGVADNTLILFTADNGGVFRPEREMPQTQAYKAGLKVNGALKGGKHTVWQGGFNVPFIARWPGKIPAGSVCDEMISLADVLATTAALMGEKLPPASAAAEDSFNFLPALLGQKADPSRDHLVVHSADGVFAIRKGPWKWVEGVPVPGVRRKQSDEFHAQLYRLDNDRAETQDVMAAHASEAEELKALLGRYREGGYSRELPPMIEKQAAKVTKLPPVAGAVLLEHSLAELPGKPWTANRGTWTAEIGAVWGSQTGARDAGATLRVPVSFEDGVLDYQIQFQGADRHSLRVETVGGSFRIEISPEDIGITKNPAPGEGRDKTLPLVRKKVELQPGTWYPVRIRWQGEQATVQVADASATATHASLGAGKAALNFLVFGGRAGFKEVRLVRP